LYAQGISIPLQFSGRKRWSHAFILWLESLSLNTTAGNFALKNLLLQLHEIRLHNTNVLKQLRHETAATSIAPIINALLTVPGVAFITATTLFTEIIDIHRFPDEDHLASFIGIVPSLQSSDDTVKANSMTTRQNAFMRHMIIESAWTAVKEDPAMTLAFNELCKRMSKQDAIIRIARKLVRRIRHVWLQRQEYVYALVA
jgi:transposase